MSKPLKSSCNQRSAWLLQELEDLRIEQGLTQAELCTRAAVAVTTYRQNCNGRYATQWLDHIDNLLEALGKRLKIVDAD